MTLPDVFERLLESSEVKAVRKALATGEDASVGGLVGSLPALVAAALPRSIRQPLVVIAPTDEDAAYFQSDLYQLVEAVALYPPSDQQPYDSDHLADTARTVARAEVLDGLQVGRLDLIVTSADAVYERIAARAELAESTVRIERGQSLDPEQLTAQLTGLGFQYVDFAEEPGDLAVRGGIVDVFPYAGTYPIRLEFFGDEVESIREFDPTSQRSISDKAVVRVFPDITAGVPGSGETGKRETLFDHLPEEARIVLVKPREVLARIEGLFAARQTEYKERSTDVAAVAPDELYLDHGTFANLLIRFQGVELSAGGADDNGLTLRSAPQPDFNGHLQLLRRRLEGADTGETLILCDSKSQRTRLEELLEPELATGNLALSLGSLHEGFELPSLGLRVYTDHQVFNRYHRPSTRKASFARAGLSLRDIRSLKSGDFVVHVDYGIGRFDGMRKIEVRGRIQEAVCLKYRDDDTLFVNVNALHKLSKYKGKEGAQPGLTKLGSGQWERTKARTRKRVKDIARDLIKLYAKRHATPGFAFSPDTLWQREMEASFEFEDTPDQAEAAQFVKEDMMKPIPMDRLVCGDVGFGKTEIAVRAAFKAVQDGKQVAVLVPTTVLATQHLETFRKRLADYPVRVEVLSRFVPAPQQKEILAATTAGDVDILIGTHRIVSKDVGFKDLGLMIIDEEQRFGVAVKEKLRQMRVNVDTLTLTATPIPRTLQFSLLGARDLSIVGTPPPNRQPILTEIHGYSTDLIRDAINYELSRGGQVFFIHNRVRSIEEMSASLRALVPDARMQVAHGQMRATQLEKVMLGFKRHDFDILVSTNIIENGLDISNANTIIINHANRFGLSELHQIRGRVGRSDRKAFCYLLVPSIHGMTREARQRLTAIEEFSDLGSGFNLAMRDLDIRGAGNMLGAEQSGFIADVGFETYHRILDDAVRELRAEEFAELFKDKPVTLPPMDTTVELDLDAMIPAEYLRQENERLNVYKRISEASEPEKLADIRKELEDRFGPPPESVDNLLAASHMRVLGGRTGLTKITFKNERLFLTFPTQEQYPVFYQHIFHPLLEKLSQLQNRYVLKESKGGKLRAIVQEVGNLDVALRILAALVPAAAANE